MNSHIHSIISISRVPQSSRFSFMNLLKLSPYRNRNSLAVEPVPSGYLSRVCNFGCVIPDNGPRWRVARILRIRAPGNILNTLKKKKTNREDLQADPMPRAAPEWHLSLSLSVFPFPPFTHATVIKCKKPNSSTRVKIYVHVLRLFLSSIFTTQREIKLAFVPTSNNFYVVVVSHLIRFEHVSYFQFK